MQLIFDRSLSLALQTEGNALPLTQLEAQRGDGEIIQLRFLDGGKPVTLTGLEEFRFVAKPIAEQGWSADAHALCNTWTNNSSAGRIEGQVNYNVSLLNAMLLHGEDDEKASIKMQAQFAWRVNNTAKWRRSQWFEFILHNNVWRGDETDPATDTPEESAGTPTGIPVATVIEDDVVNNNATANTIANITGLSAAVQSGALYHFRFVIPYTSAATTTGARFSINGPASPTFLAYRSTYTLTGTTQTLNEGLTAYDLPAAANASSLTAGNLAILEGILQPSADGTLIARFASEVSGSAITVKAGACLFLTRLPTAP